MERREFLSCVGCALGLAAAGLSSVAPEAVHIQRACDPLFVGLGDGGINFVNALSAELAEGYLSFPFISGEINRADGLSACPLAAHERQRLENLAIFSRHQHEVSRVILMAGLSRDTGGELVTSVAQRYLMEGANVAAVVTLPFKFEGTRWRSEAQRQLADIRAAGIPVHVIDNAAAIEDLPSDSTLLQAYRLANSKVIALAAREAWPNAPALGGKV